MHSYLHRYESSLHVYMYHVHMHSDVYTRVIFSPGHRYVNKATKMADRRRRRRCRRLFRCSLSQCATTFVDDDDTTRTRRRFANRQGLSISMNRRIVRNDNAMSRSSLPAHILRHLYLVSGVNERREVGRHAVPLRSLASFIKIARCC